MNSVMIIVIGMTIVTFIPRVIPFFILSDKELPKKLKMFLEYVPYTALGALIIPGAITAVPRAPEASIVGLTFAVLYSYFKGGIIVSVVGSIGIVYMVLFIFA
ncbi:AzlD domain-containing protein [Clostridium sp. DL1XJH146]